jgi:hypothetical protein
MGITPRFTASDVNGYLQKAMAEIDGYILETMKITGERFVETARLALNIDPKYKQRVLTASEIKKGMRQPVKGDYLDDSKNLRNSIGYVVLKDGAIISEGFPGGSAEAKSLAMSLRRDGYQLIGVAGMDYASHVEARGYNVITSQADYALIDLTDTLRRLQERYNRRGVGLSFGDTTGATGGRMR